MVRFDHAHRASSTSTTSPQLVDERTKLVCCHRRVELPRHQAAAARASGGSPTGAATGSRTASGGSLLLVDARAARAEQRSSTSRRSDVDYLAFSFHKMLAPFGVGVLYAKEHLLARSLPFLYGGDMIAEGQVSPDHVEYNELPWKYAAGTPNILGVIVSAQALRLLVDLVGDAGRAAVVRRRRGRSRARRPRPRWAAVGAHTRRADRPRARRPAHVAGITLYGPAGRCRRSPLVAFNVAGVNPIDLADGLNELGVEARAGCHCATLAHRDLGLTPPASCRLSFALYTTPEDVERAVRAVDAVAARLRAPERVRR